MKDNNLQHLPFFFDKPIRFAPGEREMLLARADQATASLKRNQKRDGLLSPVAGLRMLSGKRKEMPHDKKNRTPSPPTS